MTFTVEKCRLYYFQTIVQLHGEFKLRYIIECAGSIGVPRRDYTEQHSVYRVQEENVYSETCLNGHPYKADEIIEPWQNDRALQCVSTRL